MPLGPATGHIHDSDLNNLIPCKLDRTSTPFSDEKIIKYDIEIPPYGNKVGFYLLEVTQCHI